MYLFFLKLPKILHKGKLCSLLYALSYEAKYPLIVDQRRLKNLEGNDKMWAIANLRGKLLLYSRKFRRPSRCLNQSYYFLFAILYSDQTKVCKEELRRAFEAKTRNQCCWWSYEKGAGESKDTVISRKIRVSDKGGSLIKYRREQKSSHNLTGPHNSISRIK